MVKQQTISRDSLQISLADHRQATVHHHRLHLRLCQHRWAACHLLQHLQCHHQWEIFHHHLRYLARWCLHRHLHYQVIWLRKMIRWALTSYVCLNRKYPSSTSSHARSDRLVWLYRFCLLLLRFRPIAYARIELKLDIFPGLIPAAPPMMSEGGGPPPPPPPPPPPFFGGPGGLPPPPPPFPGMLPGGGPPPPPPMGMGLAPLGIQALETITFCLHCFFSGPPPLPDYLPTKQKYVVGEPVKKIAWNKVNPQTIKKESLWASIDEKRCQNKDFFLSIKENFATKAAPSKTLLVQTTYQPAICSFQRNMQRRIVTRNLLPPQRTRRRPKIFVYLIHELARISVRWTTKISLSSSLSSSFVAIMFTKLKSTPQQFRQWILACDSVHLTSDLLAQLDKSLPTVEEFKKLSELKNEINDLPDSEQYFCAVSDAKTEKNFLVTSVLSS